MAASPWWITRPPALFACSPTCEECALIGWPLQKGRYTDAEHVAYLHLQQRVRGGARGVR